MESIITKINQKSDSRKKLKPKEPPLYKVIMHNDNITTMDFVIDILQMIYDKNHDEAIEIMLKIHNTGNAVVGVYPLDIAVSKINKTHQLARAKGFPLKCTYEKA